jgi:hypothetical protein
VTLKCQPNLKVKSIMTMSWELFGYRIKYGKAWRATQWPWKMAYGDWEESYGKLPALFNAMKTKNLGMHYEYIPKRTNERMIEKYSSMLSGVSHSASRSSGVVVLCSLLMVLFCLGSIRHIVGIHFM